MLHTKKPSTEHGAPSDVNSRKISYYAAPRIFLHPFIYTLFFREFTTDGAPSSVPGYYSSFLVWGILFLDDFFYYNDFLKRKTVSIFNLNYLNHYKLKYLIVLN